MEHLANFIYKIIKGSYYQYFPNICNVPYTVFSQLFKYDNIFKNFPNKSYVMNTNTIKKKFDNDIISFLPFYISYRFKNWELLMSHPVSLPVHYDYILSLSQ